MKTTITFAAALAKGEYRVWVRTALVYAGELDRSVEADGYFDAIIPFRTLMGF